MGQKHCEVFSGVHTPFYITMYFTVTREWRKLHNKELNHLYSSPNIVRVIKLRRMRCMGERRGVYRVLVGKPEGKRPLGRSRREWEDKRGIIIEGSLGSGMWGYGVDRAGSG